MKSSTFLMAFTIAAALLISATGCKKNPVGPTPIPGKSIVTSSTPGTPIGIGGDNKPFAPGNDEVTKPINLPNLEDQNTQKPKIDDRTPEGLKAPGADSPYEQVDKGPHTEDVSVLAAYTVYFDTDKNTIKETEAPKLQSIADYLKANPKNVLRIEGYCDERGTEGYNLALGDRRAIAIREYLVTLGVESGRMKSVSFGEAKPVDSGHNEEAWRKNRRGAPVVLIPLA
jgi:peptidoglycan-associated lipoprotein